MYGVKWLRGVGNLRGKESGGVVVVALVVMVVVDAGRLIKTRELNCR